jgi:phosphoglycolate phosphatase-like HAD superfamily hydrolase
MRANIATALVDVDGTLADTNYLHVTTWWEAFAQAGHQVPMPAIHRAIGMGSDQLLDAAQAAGPGTRAVARMPKTRPAHSSRQLHRPARVRCAS